MTPQVLIDRPRICAHVGVWRRHFVCVLQEVTGSMSLSKQKDIGPIEVGDLGYFAETASEQV